MRRGFKGDVRRQTGAEVQAQCLAYFRRLPKLQVERINTGAAWLTGKDGKPQLVKFNPKGTGDIEGWLNDGTGRKFMCECKATKELPTIEQFRRVLQINQAGGVAFWTDNVELAIALIDGVLNQGERIAYTGIRSPLLALPGEVVKGELRTWNGTPKQRLAQPSRRRRTAPRTGGSCS